MRLDDVLYGVRSSGCRTHMSTWPSAASVRVHADSYKASGVPFLEFFYDCGRRHRILSRVWRWRRLCTRRQVQYVFTRMPACPHIAPHSAREIEIPAFNCSRERPNTARMRVCAQAGRSYRLTMCLPHVQLACSPAVPPVISSAPPATALSSPKSKLSIVGF